MIYAWSYSRLSDFERCKFKAYLKYVKKIPEPASPAMDRGSMVHKSAEAFVKDEADLIPELKHFEEELHKLKELHKNGQVSVEGEWAFSREWLPTDWFARDTWVRIKLDVAVSLDDARGVVIDYKTGRRKGHEIAHEEQGQLYQLAQFLRNPKMEEVTVEFWYLDLDELHSRTYTRDEGLRLMKYFDRRGAAMTNAKDFPPSPNMFNCRFCPYRPGAGGQCEVGVDINGRANEVSQKGPR